MNFGHSKNTDRVIMTLTEMDDIDISIYIHI
jgi:hypothetical protein